MPWTGRRLAVTLAEWVEVLETADDVTIGAFCDWCEDNGDPGDLRRQLERHRSGDKWFDIDRLRQCAVNFAKELLPLAPLRGYDWEQAFCYAGKDEGYRNGAPERALPNDDVSVEPFSRMDVAEVLATHVGGRDTDNWLVAGRLHDGRWFFLDAGCDYTGWD